MKIILLILAIVVAIGSFILYIKTPISPYEPDSSEFLPGGAYWNFFTGDWIMEIVLTAVISGVLGTFFGIFITSLCVAASDKRDNKR